jgi:hypothetical protein
MTKLAGQGSWIGKRTTRGGHARPGEGSMKRTTKPALLAFAVAMLWSGFPAHSAAGVEAFGGQTTVETAPPAAVWNSPMADGSVAVAGVFGMVQASPIATLACGRRPGRAR